MTNRWLVAGLVVSMGINLIQATAIRFMLPLEKIVPYFLVASPTIPGQVQPASIVAKAFTPDQLQKRVAIEDWVNELWVIDPARTRQNLDHATTLTAGSAVQEMRAFIKQERMFGRMEESPNLRRDATVLSTDFIADDIAIVRLALTERENGIPKPPTYKSMTIHFVTTTPQTYKEARRSPIGLTISDFTWSDAAEWRRCNEGRPPPTRSAAHRHVRSSLQRVARGRPWRPAVRRSAPARVPVQSRPGVRRPIPRRQVHRLPGA
ncbi:type IV secretion system protein [Burkholderia glumae]|uniref:type IV secretion system protein n=1 Tax=Burkholderia glumae TaxID=337 RepID=UPI002150D547|nr:type IV secretion system protein [Burkholderia glumae]